MICIGHLRSIIGASFHREANKLTSQVYEFARSFHPDQIHDHVPFSCWKCASPDSFIEVTWKLHGSTMSIFSPEQGLWSFDCEIPTSGLEISGLRAAVHVTRLKFHTGEPIPNPCLDGSTGSERKKWALAPGSRGVKNGVPGQNTIEHLVFFPAAQSMNTNPTTFSTADMDAYFYHGSRNKLTMENSWNWAGSYKLNNFRYAVSKFSRSYRGWWGAWLVRYEMRCLLTNFAVRCLCKITFFALQKKDADFGSLRTLVEDEDDFLIDEQC